jgi:chondroitin-sulfate-ABC endolyase/exolyase
VSTMKQGVGTKISKGYTYFYRLLLAWVLLSGAWMLPAQSFEDPALPTTVTVVGNTGDLQLSREYFKDGNQSLLWSWSAEKSSLRFSDPGIREVVESFNRRGGLKLWIHNEEPLSSPLVFTFKDKEGNACYTFNFNMNFTGWRAAWIAYSDMWTPQGGKTTQQDVVTMEIESPEGVSSGKVWLDRLEFSNQLEHRTTPDAQIPDNNRHLTRALWHWGLLYQWEQQPHGIPVPARLSPIELGQLNLVYENTKGSLKKRGLSDKEKEELQRLTTLFAISDDAKRGAPLMQKDNLLPGDVSYGQLNKLLDLLSRSWYADGNESAKKEFVKTVRYMLNQGFAFESGMGTNHHYGYEIRDLYGAIWWMEDVLREADIWEETRKAVTYWSGLQETRAPYNRVRDEITDSWNTLLIPRLTCALWPDNENERFRNLKSLARWVNGSLQYSPGTIGGIKVDGTAFHHGGHYPAYSVPGFASLGVYLSHVNNTQFTLTQEAFEVFKHALLTIARQSNTRDWGIGNSGRHPFNGAINKSEVLAFAYAAMVPLQPDRELAGEYLRLMEGLRKYTIDERLERSFREAGITANKPPTGFYVYNHASQGVYRYNDKMVSMKGFTQNVWGSELYTRDNRFGRYQSYGSIQIIGTRTPEPQHKGRPVTEEASRYSEAGWDWNRNPGTTTIHLPLELLESPLRGSDMLRQPESFAGASRLNDGEFGMFAMKLGERDRERFTPSFHARKSAFAFGNKIIALGSAIGNDNGEYPTETTLFQQALWDEGETIVINQEKASAFPYRKEVNKGESEAQLIVSLTGEHYYIPAGQSLVIEKKAQQSRENKRMQPTEGKFATAYIDHGTAPNNESYEYMIVMDATRSQLRALQRGQTGYSVLKHDSAAHIVKDDDSNARGYAIFDELEGEDDEYLAACDKEVMVMIQPKGNRVHLSVCDPDLYLGEYKYTTAQECQPVTKRLTLKGRYKPVTEIAALDLQVSGNNTILSVTCQHGIPVEFTLEKQAN